MLVQARGTGQETKQAENHMKHRVPKPHEQPNMPLAAVSRGQDTSQLAQLKRLVYIGVKSILILTLVRCRGG